MRLDLAEADPSSDFARLTDPQRAGRAIAHMARLLAAETLEAVWAETVAAFRTVGFAHLIYGYSPEARGAVLGPVADFLILSTLPGSFVRDMVAREFHWQSITFNWALRNVGLASWSMDPVQAGMPAGFAQRPEALAFFAEGGLTAGVSVGFAWPRSRGAAALALIAPEGVSQQAVDASLPALGDTIFTLGSVAHRALVGLPWRRPSGDLTERQREVLEWVAEGKTTADIATILGLRPATVEKHLRLARQCLGVETTAHALVKATFLNQLFVRGSVSGSPGPFTGLGTRR